MNYRCIPIWKDFKTWNLLYDLVLVPMLEEPRDGRAGSQWKAAIFLENARLGVRISYRRQWKKIKYQEEEAITATHSKWAYKPKLQNIWRILMLRKMGNKN